MGRTIRKPHQLTGVQIPRQWETADPGFCMWTSCVLPPHTEEPALSHSSSLTPWGSPLTTGMQVCLCDCSCSFARCVCIYLHRAALVTITETWHEGVGFALAHTCSNYPGNFVALYKLQDFFFSCFLAQGSCLKLLV